MVVVTVLVKAGVYCLRGGGHWDTYDQDEGGMCGSKGPDVFIDVDIEDYGYYPPWLQHLVDHQLSSAPEGSDGTETLAPSSARPSSGVEGL